MKKSLIMYFATLYLLSPAVFASESGYTVDDVRELLRNQEKGNWSQKHFGSGLKYLVSFESREHEGKLSWNKHDMKEGKLEIVKAMELARRWAIGNAPFGEKRWGVESVTLHFNPGTNSIEYIYSISLTTLIDSPVHKAIQIFVLPNYELIVPEFDPKL